MKRYDYYKPASLSEALAISSEVKTARFIAGGTDLMVRIRDKAIAPEALISLRSLPELSGIFYDDVVRIGAATTIGAIERSPMLMETHPVLVQAARRVGGPQIRNAGTIGGNLCNASPCADTALPLLVLEARLKIGGPRGAREIRLEELFRSPRVTSLAPDEILTHIVLAKQSSQAKAVFLKKGRVKMDLAIASLAMLLEMDGNKCQRARIAAGSVAPIPIRLHEAESILEGKPLTGDVVARAAEAAMEGVSPITDVRSTAVYRRHIVGVFMKRAIATLVGRETA